MALLVLCMTLVDMIRLKVPLRALERTQKEETASGKQPGRRELRILVVEDSTLSFTLTSAMIERITNTIPDRACDGEEAIIMMQRECYDLVFMDQFMPAMSGIEATRAIRKILSGNRQPIIVGLSGATTPPEIEACLEAGMDHFLTKPLRLAQMEQTLALAAAV